MLLNCYQRSSFAAPQAAICQPANLPRQIKSIFEMGSLIGRGSRKFLQPAFNSTGSAVAQPNDSKSGSSIILNKSDDGAVRPTIAARSTVTTQQTQNDH